MEFATDVIGDNVLQRQSGEALRNTVTYAVKPSLSTCKFSILEKVRRRIVYNFTSSTCLNLILYFFFLTVLSVFGLALLFFSASALGNARISARQGKEIDAAASVVAKTIGNHVVSIIAKVFSMPVKAVSGLTSAIISTLLFPFQLIGRAAGAVGVAGQAVYTTMVDLFVKATSFPAFVQDVVSLSFQTMLGYLYSIVDNSYIWITSLPGTIVYQSRVLLSALGESILKGSKSIWNIISSNTLLLLTSTGSRVSTVSASILTSSRSKLDTLGARIYILLASIISSSRSNLDKLGTEVLVVLSNFLSNLLGNFKGSSSKGSTT